MSSSQSNKLGQIHVEWYIKTQILRYKVLGGLRPPKFQLDRRVMTSPGDDLFSICFDFFSSFLLNFNFFISFLIVLRCQTRVPKQFDPKKCPTHQHRPQRLRCLDVSACLVARNSNCPKSTLCIGLSELSTDVPSDAWISNCRLPTLKNMP